MKKDFIAIMAVLAAFFFVGTLDFKEAQAEQHKYCEAVGAYSSCKDLKIVVNFKERFENGKTY